MLLLIPANHLHWFFEKQQQQQQMRNILFFLHYGLMKPFEFLFISCRKGSLICIETKPIGDNSIIGMLVWSALDLGNDFNSKRIIRTWHYFVCLFIEFRDIMDRSMWISRSVSVDFYYFCLCASCTWTWIIFSFFFLRLLLSWLHIGCIIQMLEIIKR